MKTPPSVVTAEEYENYHPGNVVDSSKTKAWQGLHFTQFSHPKTSSGAPRPATADHILAFGCQGAVKGESKLNSDKWRPYVWYEHEFFLGSALANDRDSRWETLSGENDDLLVAYLHLSPRILYENAQRVINCNPDDIELPSKFGFKDPLMLQLGLSIKQELGGGNFFGNLFVETAANLLAVHLLQHYCVIKYPVKDFPQSAKNMRAIQKAKDYIHDHLDEDLSLEKIAKVTSMSSFHFARLFKEYTGSAPHQYVVSERIKKAKILLSTTKIAINRIALEIGYTPNHFSQLFKRVVKVTPATYRKQTC